MKDVVRDNRWNLRKTRAALGLAVAIFSYGCGVAHIRSLRDAQATFSRAAEIENRERFGDPTALSDMTEATTGYRVAAQMLDELIARNKNNLQKDNLLCTAYVIRAMSLWRLGDHDRARSTATQAQEGSSCAPGNDASLVLPRERALLRALPGLVRIDQANAKVGNDKHDVEDFVAIKGLVRDARDDLHAAQALVPHNHPVQVYLLISELAAVRVWQAAIDSERLTQLTRPKREDEVDAVREGAKTTIRKYRDFLVKELGRRPDDSGLQVWMNLLGISPGDIANP